MNVVLASASTEADYLPKGNFISPLIHESTSSDTYESYAWKAEIPNHPIFEGNQKISAGSHKYRTLTKINPSAKV